MPRSHTLLSGASGILAALPFAQSLTRQTPSPQFLAAAGILNNPLMRRYAPGLAAVATTGLAAVAVVSFVKGLRRKSQRQLS